MKMKLMVGALLLLTGFLVGFLPEYSDVRALRQDLEKTDVERAANRSKLVVSHLDDLASMMYLEATRRNYGSAADYSTRFFDNVGQVLNTQSDPQLAVAWFSCAESSSRQPRPPRVITFEQFSLASGSTMASERRNLAIPDQECYAINHSSRHGSDERVARNAAAYRF